MATPTTLPRGRRPAGLAQRTLQAAGPRLTIANGDGLAGDPVLDAPFGLSGDPSVPYPTVCDGRLFPANLATPTSATVLLLIAQREYYYPVWFPSGVSPTEMAVYVTVAAASSNGAMALYAMGANRAVGAQLARGTFDPTTTGLKTVTFAAPGAATWFWFGVWSDAAPTLRGATPSFAALGNNVNLFEGVVGVVRASIATVGSALPATAPTAVAVLKSQAVPIPSLKA